MEQVFRAARMGLVAAALWAGAVAPARAQMPGGGPAVPPGGMGGGYGFAGGGYAAGGYVAGGGGFGAAAATGYGTELADWNMGKFFYYPYYYFPHSYWPTMCPKWPERPGQHYLRPPAYMAYPPFKEPHWRYYWYEPHRFYRGFHFWLDQF